MKISRRSDVTEVSGSSAVFLHEDILVEILSKLPAKALLRFRCVSQLWYALTKSSDFIARHLVHSSSFSDNQSRHPCFLICSKLISRDNPRVRSKFGVTLLRGEEKTSLRLPFLPNDGSLLTNLYLMGSSNGLVSCYLIIGTNEEYPMIRARILVWNPATEQFRFLPKPNNTIPHYLHQDDEAKGLVNLKEKFVLPLISFDFVHDHDITEYKLVRVFHHILLHYDDHGNAVFTGSFRAQVFVQSTDSWRLVENELAFPSCNNCSPYTAITLQGVLYWKVQRVLEDCYVVSFNLREEVFNVIQLPSHIRYHTRDAWEELPLLPWKDSLATALWDCSTGEIWIWAMSSDHVMKTSNESGIQMQSPVWTRQLRVKTSLFTENDIYLWRGSWNDQLLFTFDIRDDENAESAENNVADNAVPQFLTQELFLYDPKSQTERKLHKDGESGERFKFYEAHNYVESLVEV